MEVVALRRPFKPKGSKHMETKGKQNRPEAVDELPDSRTRLVRVPRLVDSSIFGGWGIKI